MHARGVLGQLGWRPSAVEASSLPGPKLSGQTNSIATTAVLADLKRVAGFKISRPGGIELDACQASSMLSLDCPATVQFPTGYAFLEAVRSDTE
mmetsp:Transcript_38729/g.102453  ORF Transcript_38729/g.102453 Transcript_38729/m.102453 type:complete len:94 (+) Transcript_38729:197-478(+)